MDPIKTHSSNFVYRGPTKEIADLHCQVHGRDTFSVWQLTDDERAAIANGANIQLGIYGVHPIPPVSLRVVPGNGPWAPVPAPCRVCGLEIADRVHESGPGTHAYKTA